VWDEATGYSVVSGKDRRHDGLFASALALSAEFTHTFLSTGTFPYFNNGSSVPSRGVVVVAAERCSRRRHCSAGTFLYQRGDANNDNVCKPCGQCETGSEAASSCLGVPAQSTDCSGCTELNCLAHETFVAEACAGTSNGCIPWRALALQDEDERSAVLLAQRTSQLNGWLQVGGDGYLVTYHVSTGHDGVNARQLSRLGEAAGIEKARVAPR
jgi:hypothetical protein